MLKFLVGALLFGAALAIPTLIGGSRCTWGPSYWCSEIGHAKECSTVQHCITNVWSQRPASPVNGDDTCTFCEDIIGDVKNFLLSNKTEAEIEAYVQMACGYMPDDYSQTECKNIMDHYLNEVYQLIGSKLDPQAICTLIKLCSPAIDVSDAPAISTLVRIPLKTSGLKVAFPTPSDMACDACKLFMDEANQQLSNKTVQDYLVSIMEKECTALGSEADECKALVDQYAPSFFDFVTSNVNENLCFMAGICTGQKVDIDLRSKLLDWVRRSGLLKTVHMSAVDDEKCTVCEEVIGYIKIFISNNQTEEQIQELIDSEVCPALGAFAETCKDLVDAYLPELYQKLVDALDPVTVCTDLKLCTASVGAAAPVVKAPLKDGPSPNCILCEFAMDKLDSMLSQNATKEEIITKVKGLCAQLPASFRDECDALIDQYGDQIIDMLVQKLSPKVVCTALGVCTSEQKQKPQVDYHALSNSEQCEVCGLVLNYVRFFLEKNSSVDSIIESVDKVCHFLPGNAGVTCDTFVQQYGRQVIEMLINDVDPKMVCTKLGLCPGAKVDGLVHLLKSSTNSNI